VTAPTGLLTSTGPGAGNAISAFATTAKDGSPVVHVSTTNYPGGLPDRMCRFPGPSWPGVAEAFGCAFDDVADRELAGRIRSWHLGLQIVRIDASGITNDWRVT
jgi:hypothetical protein